MSSRPKILIDARMVGPVPHGIARYVTRLASGLRTLDRSLDRSEVAGKNLGYEPVFLVSEDFPHSDFEGWEIKRLRSGFLSPRELVEIPRVIGDAKLYHSPSFSSLFASGPLALPIPWIVTIHDLNHLTFGTAIQKAYYRFLLKPFARNAAALVTVSEFSRGEISSWMGVRPEKIETVYNSLDQSELEQPDESKSLSVLNRFRLEAGKYFLCLSNPKPHKNVEALVRAYREAGVSWPLVLSMRGFPGIPGVRAVGGLSDDDLRVLRAHAGAMVFPSLYEGFGLPPIEAIASGVPLVVSRIAPHEEGLADVRPEEIRWVDPRSISSMADALAAAFRGDLASASEATRAKFRKRFSEVEMATRMDHIYRRVLHLPS